MRSGEVSSIGQARGEFLRKESPWALGAGIVVLVALRGVVGDFSWRDGVAVAAMLAIYPFGEWAIHVYLLHARPMRIRGREIETVAARVYGAGGVEYSPQATKQLATYEKAGFGTLPVCIAKTHLSISSDPSLKGAPTGWTLPVREVRASVGAGFVYPICGEMRTMPGLSANPAAARIDLDDYGEIVGLSLSAVS